MKLKVLLGLSGGVDSAVSLLLCQQFSHVECAFMVNWDRAVNGDLPAEIAQGCDSVLDYRDAQLVCEQLQSNLKQLNYVAQYWDLVFEPFLNSYKKGWTPNPDVFCNKYIKFALFLDYSNQHGYDYVAMGHYAQVFYNCVTKQYELYRADDRAKDQTYFLAFLNQAQLAKVIFPVGHLQKTAVRKIAQDHHFANASKKDSTGICFIGERNFDVFLNHYLPGSKGPIIDVLTKEIVGYHHNIYLYTIGQNKYLHLAGQKAKYFVVGKNVHSNNLYVTTKEHLNLIASNRAVLQDVHWINDPPTNRNNLTVQFRHRQHPVKVKMIDHDDKVCTITYETTRAVTCGQIAVLYEGDRCLGGGVIAMTFAHQRCLENWD